MEVETSKKVTSIGVLLFIIIFSKNALSWDDGITHKDLSEYAAESSVLNKDKGDYLRTLGFFRGLKEPIDPKWEIRRSC